MTRCICLFLVIFECNQHLYFYSHILALVHRNTTCVFMQQETQLRFPLVTGWRMSAGVFAQMLLPVVVSCNRSVTDFPLPLFLGLSNTCPCLCLTWSLQKCLYSLVYFFHFFSVSLFTSLLKTLLLILENVKNSGIVSLSVVLKDILHNVLMYCKKLIATNHDILIF